MTPEVKPELKFTPREQSILRVMANPHLRGAADMARDLGLSESTFKVYMSRLYEKIGLGTPGSQRPASQRLLVLWIVKHRPELLLCGAGEERAV